MAELFEEGQSYIFYFNFGSKMGRQEFSGRVISYEHPLVKVETDGLIRIINCASDAFIEALMRRQHVENGVIELEK